VPAAADTAGMGRAVPGGAGILLTGGTSRRMGRDKATIEVGGERMAVRAAGVLRGALAGPFLEVGPGVSGLPAVHDEPPGQGPLAAVAAAAAVLGCAHPAILLAVDMPAASATLIRLIAAIPADGSAVPVDEDGQLQLLCARWSAAAVSAAPGLVAAGHRSLRELLGIGPVTRIEMAQWSAVAPRHAFRDTDTPDDLAALEALL
jgi:molybdopterin-guanine dinucleotide biosynthesis protein A